MSEIIQSNQLVDFSPSRAGRNFFATSVNWLTSARGFPGHCVVHRAAQADFNVRGWQGRWRHTAPTALFFALRPGGAISGPADFPASAGSSQAGDLRSAGIAGCTPASTSLRNPS
jgi:hypothetical protein